MDGEPRERLLLVRSEELQHEYENLVRSLDAAYETVRAINCALADNRTESRRVFQERLSLASHNRQTARQHDLRIHFSNDSLQNDGQNVVKRFFTKYLDDANVPRRDALVSALFNKDSLTSKQQQQPEPQRGDAIAPSLIYSEHLQTAESPARTQQYSSTYVGDEHSYAVNEGCEQQQQQQQQDKEIDTKEGEAAAAASDGRVAAVPAGAAMVTVKGDVSEWRAIFGIEPSEDDSTEVDLTIVKTEDPDESEEPPLPREPLIIDVAQPRIKVASAFSAPQQPKRNRIRYRAAHSMTEEELKKKRKQTRERMRRWRAKKKLVQSMRSS